MNRRVALRIIAVIVIAAAVILAWRVGGWRWSDRDELLRRIADVRGHSGLSIGFVVTYALLSAIGVPASPLTLAGGALFGPARGIMLNWLGEFLGAVLAFALVRALVHETTISQFSGPRRLLARFSSDGSAMLLFRLRVVPVAPFAMLNVASALSPMSWRDYVVATALGIIPITVIYTLFSASLVAGVAGSSHRALLVALGSAAVIVVVSLLARPER